MKNKIILLFFLLGSFVGVAQPVINRTFGTNTVNDPRLSATLNLLVPRYNDTTAANSGTNRGVDSCAAIIFTYSDNSYWLRACSPKRWIKLLKTGDVANVDVNNGLSKNGDTIQFGQIVGAVGSPAALSSIREIPFNGFGVAFTGTGRIGIGTSTPSASWKMTMVASGSTGGINLIAGSGTGINVSGSGNAIDGFTSGATSVAVSGSTIGGAGSYGVQGSGASGGVAGRFYTIAAGGDATPIVMELERLPTGIGVSNGAGFTLMLKNTFTNGVSGNESGRITNYFSNAVSGAQTSAFGFHLVNNAVSARKALLSGDGQWTWDGYPALTAQTDSTTYKPIGIDGSGNVVKMANWLGSGGGSENIQQTLDYGDTSNRPIIYKPNTDSTDDIYTMQGIPSNFGTAYSGHGVAMGFSSGWQRFNGVNAPSPRPNVVYNFIQYNTSNGGGRVNTSEAAIRFGLETHFETGGADLFEAHLGEVTTYGGTIKRPLSLYINKTTGGTAYNLYALDGLNTQATNGNALFSFNGTGGYNFIGYGSNSQITLYDESLAGSRYQLQVDGSDVFHNTFGNLQRFDAELYLDDPYTNNPNLFIHDYRAANNTAGIFLDLVGTNAKFPIKVAAAVTNGIETRFDNTAGGSYLAVQGAGSAAIDIRNTDAADPAGAGYNNAYALYVAGNGAAYGISGVNYGTSAGPMIGNQFFNRTFGAFPFTWLIETTERMRLSATGALTLNNAFTFPTADGTSGQVLRTNGSGAVTFQTPTSSIAGTATNDNAVAGNIGEYISSTISSGSAVSLATTTTANVTSISLTAGDWDITGVVDYLMTSATATNFNHGVSITSATLGGQDMYVQKPFAFAGSSATLGDAVPVTRLSLASTTTVYLVAQATFSGGSIDAYGTIRARRIR